MKLENDSGISIQTPPRKSYNPFDSDEEDTDDYLKGNFNYDVKSLEKNDDSLTFHLDTTDLSWEEAILAPQILDHKNANGEKVLYRKDTELFTDKTVTECGLPELMVCCKDNAFNSVKDIGIDEGVPAHNKIWIKSRNNEESEDHSSFLDDLSFENKHQGLQFMEGVKLRPENHFEKDARVEVLTEDSVKNSRSDNEALERQSFASECETNKSKKEVDEHKPDLRIKETGSGVQITGDEMMIDDIVYDGTGNRLSSQSELNKENKESGAFEEGQVIDNVTLELAVESHEKPSIVSSDQTTTVWNENLIEEAISRSSQYLEPQASEALAANGNANVLPYNSKVESGSIFLDFNSPMKEEEKKSHVNDGDAVAKPPLFQTMSRHDDGPHVSSAMSSMDRRVHGETSFSAAMPPSALITCSGPHAHTANMSLRSESSAGSTRSFAFPVLQAEWNSSPVRMAKADERHKHRGWVHSLVCCRF